MAMEGTWPLALFAIGDIKSCIYSLCCPFCAIAQSRTNLDNSPFCFNMFCMSAPVTRFLVKSAYSIPVDSDNDLLIMYCCWPCAVNQIYQSSSILKNPVAQDGGREFNVNLWNSREKGWCKTGKTFFYGCLMPCGVGSALESGIGLPFCLGMCCVNPMAARHLIRYQYRISPDEIEDTFCSHLPYFCCMCCPFTCLCYRHMSTVQILRETKLNGNQQNPKYLVTKTLFENPLNNSKRTSPARSSVMGAMNARKVIPVG